MSAGTCKYFWPLHPETYARQKNALRVEFIHSYGQCGLLRRPGTEHVDATRFVGSGGCPMAIYKACAHRAGDPVGCNILRQFEQANDAERLAMIPEVRA